MSKDTPIMKSLLLVALALIVLGYFAGSVGQKVFADNPDVQKSEGENSHQKNDRSQRKPILSTIKSTDTVATLSKLPASELYDRLALWLLDASPSDMQEFWNEYSLREDHTNNLNDLVFINWTHIDPEAAIAAANGTDFARYPWWAWACNEPQKALTEVLARHGEPGNRDRIGEVMLGLGEFHPAWLREHIDELPEEWMRDHALMGYTKWPDSENPRESIEFLRKRGLKVDQESLTSFALESPLAAYELALELQDENGPNHGNKLTEQLIDSLARQDPALLDHLLDHAKSPQRKLEIQRKQFEGLLKIDPEAAHDRVQNMPDSWARQDLLAIMAKHYALTDPQKTLQYAAEIFHSKRNPTSRSSLVFHRDGATGLGNFSKEIIQLRDDLLKSHPKEFIEALLPKGDGKGGQYQSIASEWARIDLPALAEWTSGQEDPRVYRASAREVVYGLIGNKHFEEAMEWAESIDVANDPDGLHFPFEINQTFSSWLESDKKGALDWKENAELSQEFMEALNIIEEGLKGRSE